MTKKANKRNLTRRQLARREKEEQFQRTVTWIAAGVVILILLVVSYGVVTELVIKANQPVARVGDETISRREYQSRLRYERQRTRIELQQYQYYQQQIQETENTEGMESFIQQIQLTVANLENQLSADMSTIFGGQVLDTMIEEELVRQEAEDRGITVSPEDVDIRVEQFFGYDREAEVDNTPTLTETEQTVTTEEDYKELYDGFTQRVLKAINFSKDAFREIMRTEELKVKLQEELAEDVEEVQDQVEVTLITAGSLEAAEALQQRLNDGEDVEAILTELNEDEDDQTSGFALPWLPSGYLASQLDVEIERVAFNTPVGRASDPILASDGSYYVAYVTGHEERELSENILEQERLQEYDEWLVEAKDEKSEYLDWEEAVVTEP